VRSEDSERAMNEWSNVWMGQEWRTCRDFDNFAPPAVLQFHDFQRFRAICTRLEKHCSSRGWAMDELGLLDAGGAGKGFSTVHVDGREGSQKVMLLSASLEGTKLAARNVWSLHLTRSARIDGLWWISIDLRTQILRIMAISGGATADPLVGRTDVCH